MPAHRIPRVDSPRLSLLVPPDEPANARNFAELVQLLEALGRDLDRKHEVSRPALRDWERRVAGLLREGELDLLLRGPDADGYDPDRLAEERWKNLRAILMKRKGLG